MTIVYGPEGVTDSWQQARDAVRQDLWRPSTTGVPDDQCDRALHTALLELEAERRWLWLENVNATLTVDDEADSVDLPATVKYIAFIACLSGSLGYDALGQRPLGFVRSEARGATTGYPTYYALSNGKLYFDCKVKATTEFELLYTATCPRTLADAIATPPVTLLLQKPAIVALAASHLCLTYLKSEGDAARQRAAYERILERLMLEEDTARADAENGGTIQPDDFLFNAAHGG